MRILRRGAALFACFVVASGPAATPADKTAARTHAISQARAIIQKDIAPAVPGLAVAVAVDGQLTWSEAFGYANLAKKSPVTPTTRFRIGSISKPLAAAGLAVLVERGRLDLDAPVQKYVPEFPDKGGKITTRQLAGHLGGIRHYRGPEMLLNEPFANARAALRIFAQDPLEAAPGTKYVYSTYGWTLISAAMEAAAQQDFVEFMDEHVIRPLGLTHTRVDRQGVNDPNRTEFYEGVPGKFTVAPAVDLSYKWAGGGYLSTAEDLVRFGSALLQPGFLRRETLTLLFTTQRTADGAPINYGLGWRVLRDAQGHRVMLHTGGSVGGTSVLLLHPETKTVVAMVCNHSKSPFSKERWEAVAEMFAPVFAAAGK